MNASGEAIGPLVRYYGIEPGQVLVAVDDADLRFGEIRLRANGSSGGHHGLESIESHLGTREYPRLRIGIGRKIPGVREITGHVLGRFGTDEQVLLKQVLGRAADQMACWLTDGVQSAMNKFNGTIVDPAQEKKS
jgi:PTH1 family peptidyl-tRNA hydrolase